MMAITKSWISFVRPAPRKSLAALRLGRWGLFIAALRH
jgi:hypothetical protein